MIIAAWWPDLVSWPWSASSAVRAEKPIEGRPPRPHRPNYNQIHSRRLPVNVYPLPPIVPHNPLSVLHIVAIYIRQLVAAPPSHPEPCYQAIWSSTTGTVHVSDVRAIRVLWEKGFFGKGSLSRSEPTWLEREKRKIGVTAVDTSEQFTRQRREERRQFKNERAKKEREAIEERLRQETTDTLNRAPDLMGEDREGIGSVSDEHSINSSRAATSTTLLDLLAGTAPDGDGRPDRESPSNRNTQHLPIPQEPEDVLPVAILNREHLQLSPEEAFFLVYALGVLSIHHQSSPTPIEPIDLLTLFCSHSSFPPDHSLQINPSNPFLVSYAVYHHFRALGWVVRSGIKFGVDYLLYQRGPAFAHAQFSIVVVPSYKDPYWTKKEQGEKKGKSWWWLHAVNRVQSQVLKNLVVVYVEVPPPVLGQGKGEVKDVTRLLESYKIREMVFKRWTPNRTRD